MCYVKQNSIHQKSDTLKVPEIYTHTHTHTHTHLNADKQKLKKALKTNSL